MAWRRPLTSTLTVWSEAAFEVVAPLATIFVKALSSATSQLTAVSGPLPEPGTASGVGVIRVHSSTPSGSGSPEAMPCRKAGASAAEAEAAEVATARAGAATTAVAAAALTTVRRLGVEESRLVTADQTTDR